MKRITLTLIALLSTMCALHAQNKIYVCEGYTYDVFQLDTLGDITPCADGSINIGLENYLSEDIDSIVFAEPQFPQIKIVYNGSTATVTIPESFTGVTYSVNGANVTITNTNTTDEYLYSVSGTSTSGSLTINGEYKLTLELAGLDLTNTKGGAIDIECGKRIDLLLKDGTVNNIADCANGAHKGAFYTKGHLEIKGGGTLNLTGNTKHALCAKEYIEIKKSAGTINILKAMSDGIHCGKGLKGDGENNFFKINGGTVNMENVGGDCIDSDDYGCVNIKGGTLNLAVTSEDVSAIKCDSIFKMSNGQMNINVKGRLCEAIRSCYTATFSGGTIVATISGEGSKLVKGKKNTKVTDTVRNGGDLFFMGTTIDVTLDAGTYTKDQSYCTGIRGDKDVEISNGDIKITVNNSAALPLHIIGTLNQIGGNITYTAGTPKIGTDNWTGGSRNGQMK